MLLKRLGNVFSLTWSIGKSRLESSLFGWDNKCSEFCKLWRAAKTQTMCRLIRALKFKYSPCHIQHLSLLYEFAMKFSVYYHSKRKSEKNVLELKKIRYTFFLTRWLFHLLTTAVRGTLFVSLPWEQFDGFFSIHPHWFLGKTPYPGIEH